MDRHKSVQRAPQVQATSASGGMLLRKTLKNGSLETPFSSLSGRNMWQNGTDNFIIYHKINLNIPFKLFHWSTTSLRLRHFSKSGHFVSRLKSS